jgi:hypothetical protein
MATTLESRELDGKKKAGSAPLESTARKLRLPKGFQ